MGGCPEDAGQRKNRKRGGGVSEAVEERAHSAVFFERGGRRGEGLRKPCSAELLGGPKLRVKTALLREAPKGVMERHRRA